MKDKPRTGRPRKLSDGDRRAVVRTMNKLKVKTAESVRKEVSVKENINVSTSTIARALKESGYVARVKKKRPLLTRSTRKETYMGQGTSQVDFRSLEECHLVR